MKNKFMTLLLSSVGLLGITLGLTACNNNASNDKLIHLTQQKILLHILEINLVVLVMVSSLLLV